MLRVELHGPLVGLHRRFVVEGLFEASAFLVVELALAVVRFLEGADLRERFLALSGTAERLGRRHPANELVRAGRDRRLEALERTVVIGSLDPAQAKEVGAVLVLRDRFKGLAGFLIPPHDPEPDSGMQGGPWTHVGRTGCLVFLAGLIDERFQLVHLARHAVGERARVQKIEPARRLILKDFPNCGLLPRRHTLFPFLN